MLVFARNMNILSTQCEALLMPCNCMFINGAGLAKAVQDEMGHRFRQIQKPDLPWKPGCLYLVSEKHEAGKPDIWAATTKNHYSNPSQLKWIEDICYELAGSHSRFDRYKSVALPRLGCGLGGLDFNKQVLPLFREYLDPQPNTFVVYP